MSTQALKPLTLDMWPDIRDIILPLAFENDRYIINRALMEEAIAYTGELEPCRLYTKENPDVFERLAEIYMSSEDHLQTHDKFRITHAGGSFRCQRADTETGPILALRALPATTPGLSDLRMPSAWRMLLNDSALLNGGLILVVATNGQGKTTTCSATIKTRLETYGGIAYTVEDPVELPLSGWHGRGRCFQMPAQVDDGDMPGSGYAKAMLKTLRLYPSLPSGGTMLFVGEIRDPKTAAETLLAAMNGHTVIATLHAQSIPTALIRLATLATATEDRMEAGAVQQMLGEVLRGVIHQKLTYDATGQGWSRGNLRGSLLWVNKDDVLLADAVRTAAWTTVAARVEAQTKVVDLLEAGPAPGGDADRPRFTLQVLKSALTKATS